MQQILQNRTILKGEGTDIIEFLGGQITSNIFNLSDDLAQHALLLTPQGKILADLFLYQVEQDIYIELSSEIKDWFLKRMKMYKLRSDVDFVEMPNLAMQLSFAADANALSSRLDPRLKSQIYRNIVEISDVVENQDDAEIEAIMIKNHIIDFKKHYDAEQFFPSDLWFDQLGSVNYQKGCYIGQEVVSRMKHKSTALKRLFVLSSKTDIRAGDDVMQNGKKLGSVFYAKKFGDDYLALIVTRSDKVDAEALIVNQHEQFLNLVPKGGQHGS